MQIIVDDLMVSYLRRGQGTRVLLLPGWADVAANWQSFIQALARDYEVVMPDLPGFGGSQAPAQAWDLTDYAALLGKFCEKLQYMPEIIIGHSNGGGIAVRGLANGSLQAKKLVLLASAGVRGEASSRNTLLKFAAKTGKVVSKPLSLSTQNKLRRKLYGAVGSDMLVAEHMQETFKKVVADDVRADAATLHLPTLLIYGGQDDQTPLAFGQKLQQAIAGSQLQTVSQAGHFLYQTHQDEVLQLATKFMKATNAA